MKKKEVKKYVRRHEIPEGRESGILLKTVRLARILKTIASGKEIEEAYPIEGGKLNKKIIGIIKHLKESQW